MKHGPAIRLVCILALGGAAGLFQGDGHATTGVESTASGEAGSVSGMLTTRAASGQARGADADAVPGRRNDVGFSQSACQHEITDDDPATSHPAGRLCARASGSRQPFSIQMGRRIGTRDEILGEFDGVRVDYRLADGLLLNGIAGYPVLTAQDVFNPARQVFGISAATDPEADTWELNGYLMEQQESGQVVGRSMGGAVRYLQPGRSMLVYVDYDPVERSVGALMASGAVKLSYGTTVSATLDLQQRTIPELQKKYLTQSMTVMDGWDWILPDDRLALHTAGGSSEVGVLAIDLSYPLSRRVRLRGDMILLDVARDTGAVATSEYHYHLKITGKDLLLRGDRNRFDLHHSQTDSGRSYTATLDSSFSIRRFWNFISQLRADYHQPEDARGAGWEAKPKVKMEYRPSKQYGFHIEAGGSVAEGASASVADNHSTYYVSLGYRADF